MISGCMYSRDSVSVYSPDLETPRSAFYPHCDHKDHLCTTAHKTSVRTGALFHLQMIMIFDRIPHWPNAGNQ